jgi:opacity protein-like surface antigen/hemolysin activation/secretion protein
VVYAEATAGAQAQGFNPSVLAPSAKPPPTNRLRATASPSRGLDMPPNADKTFVTVRRVAVIGAFPEMEEENAAFAAKLQGQRMSIAQIFMAARDLQLAYLKAYPLARISFPVKEFPTGDVRIAISDGYIEKIDLSTVPADLRDLVQWRLEPLMGKRHLTAREYQRRTQLIGYLAGVAGQVTTQPGAALDSNVLMVEVTESRLVSSSVIDNRLPTEFGTWSFSKSASLNNALGLGEQLTFSASSTPDFDHFFDGSAKAQAYSGDVSAPIGADGLMVGAGYLSSRSRPTPWEGAFPSEELVAGERASNKFDRAYMRAAYPLFLTIDQCLKIQATYEYIDSRTRVGPAPLGLAPAGGWITDASHDNYSAARLSSEGMSQISWWEWGAKATGLAVYSTGLGGRTAWNSPIFGTPLSRPGSGPNFSKLAVKGRIDVGLPEDFRLAFVARAQTSFGQPLMITENLTLDGYDAVSGFASGTLNVDRGVTLRSELSRPFQLEFMGANATVAPYVFGAWGRGVHERAFPGEPKNVRAETFGGGLRADTSITGAPFGESLSFEIGKDFSNIPFRESGYRANVSFSVKYAGNPFDPDVSPVTGIPTKGTVKGPPPATTTSATAWNGFYAGLNAGYSWDPLSQSETASFPVWNGLDSFDPAHSPPLGIASALGATGMSGTNAGGFIGGAQVGYSRQFNNFVIGAEADIQGSNTRNRHEFLNGTPSSNLVVQNGQFALLDEFAMTHVEHEKNVDWLGTLRGRIGYLITPTLLGYATGGLAFGGVRAGAVVSQAWGGDANTLGQALQSSGSVGHFSDVRLGWTIGAGIEWMFARDMSLKAEYLYYDLGDARYPSSSLTTIEPNSGFSNIILPINRVRFRGDVARVGLNYHFGLSGEALAPPPPSPISTGLYAGLNVGYSWDARPTVATTSVPARSDLDQGIFSFNPASALSATGFSNSNADGALGGGQFGYNYRTDKFVLGLETDVQGAAVKGRGGFSNAATATVAGVQPAGLIQTSIANEKSLDWLGTLRGRAGYLVTPTLLGYATVGLAFGGVSAHSLAAQGAASNLLPLRSTNVIGHICDTRVGWTIGGGLEWMFSPKMSLKVEYLYYDLGQLGFSPGVLATSSVVASGVNTVALASRTEYDGHITRLGLNYHFGPVAALSTLVK